MLSWLSIRGYKKKPLTLFCTSQYVTACSHSSTDEHRLSRQLIVHWDEGMVRRKRPGRPLPSKVECYPLVRKPKVQELLSVNGTIPCDEREESSISHLQRALQF